jgi:hypothetical protein
MVPLQNHCQIQIRTPYLRILPKNTRFHLISWSHHWCFSAEKHARQYSWGHKACEVGGMTLLDYFAEDNIAEDDTLFFNYTVESSMQVVVFGSNGCENLERN